MKVAVNWRAIALFLAIAFGFAWLLWGNWVVAMPPGGLVIGPAFIACAIIGGFAPSIAAIAVTLAGGGRAAAGELLSTLRRPLMARHAVFALAAVPLATAVSCLLQLLAGLQLHWPAPSLLVMALVWPVMAALGEELGWRSFLTARLLPALGFLRTGLLVGVLWGLWHLPADYIALKGFGDWFWLAFLINGPIVLTAHALIMTRLWQQTAGSTVSALLYHWSITISAMVAPAPVGASWQALLAAGIGAAAMWGVFAVLLIFTRAGYRDDLRAAVGSENGPLRTSASAGTGP
jgi:membrane protease YdiL (CAAX protease family)